MADTIMKPAPRAIKEKSPPKLDAKKSPKTVGPTKAPASKPNNDFKTPHAASKKDDLEKRTVVTKHSPSNEEQNEAEEVYEQKKELKDVETIGKGKALEKGKRSSKRDVAVAIPDDNDSGVEGLDDSTTDGIAEADDSAEDVESADGDVVAVGKVAENGDIVDDDGDLIGRLSQGDPVKLAGFIMDESGQIFDKKGNVVGMADPMSDGEEDGERQAASEDVASDEEEKNETQESDSNEDQDMNEDVVEEAELENVDDEVGKPVAKDIGDLKEKEPNILDSKISSFNAGKVVLGEIAEGLPEKSKIDAAEKSKVSGVVSEVAEAGDSDLENCESRGVPSEADITDPALIRINKAEDKADIATDAAEETIQNPETPEMEAPFEVDAAKESADLPGSAPEDIADDLTSGVSSGDEIADAGLETTREHPSALGEVDSLLKDELSSNELPDVSILKGLKVNKFGNILNQEGILVGKILEGDLKKLAGKTVDIEGKVWNNAGRVIGRAETLPEADDEVDAPFDDFPGSVVDKSGKVLFEGRQVGVVIEGELKKLVGKKVDADGDILGKHGDHLGKAERQDEEEEQETEPVAEPDMSVLKGLKVNKFGNILNRDGVLMGKVVEGDLKKLAGKTVDGEGRVWNNAGKVIGRADIVTEAEEEIEGPFEDFPGSVVDKSGKVLYQGRQVGIVIEGELKKLVGKKIDADGDILGKHGNHLGKAERQDEEEQEEPEPEPKVEPEVEADTKPEAELDAVVDCSILADKKVNKAGNVVDDKGRVSGRVKEGVLKYLIGKTVDKNGEIWGSVGKVIGRAEPIPEAEKDDFAEAKPFEDFPNTTVELSGKVVSEGIIIGKLISGDPKKLANKKVDADGDVCDKFGNVLGHACLLENLPEDVPESIPEAVPEPEVVEEPQETEEQRKIREEAEMNKKLAIQMAICIEQSLDKLKPVLKLITDAINRAERQPKEELDEQELVKEVKPLIEEGGRILTEANGQIRGLDPDGRISANAKHKTAAREATPEEYRLADLLKELAGHVTETIENAKRKIEDMPHAKKELNPLWGLLSEPLFQILAAVGLLLSGVLGLVGKLLSGLGLGGLVDSLLGGLGLTKLLDSLGVGSIVGSITGKTKPGQQKKGLLG